MIDKNRVIIFDTTLRDGEQSPGFSMNLKEKLDMAHQLARLGVDVIEAGFPITSQGDFEAVGKIAAEVRGPVICGLARAVEKDIIRAGEALVAAPRKRIHTFIATSKVHVEKKLRMTPEQVIQNAYNAVKLARTFTEDVEFSCEDAGRTDWGYMVQVLTAAIEAGATTLNIPDTVGYTVPEQFGGCIAYAIKNTPGIDTCVVSVHCHNDLGFATANSLAGVKNGARQIECTINGIGERAGNTSLEEAVMMLRVRKDYFGVETGIKTEEIYRTSRLLSRITGIKVQPNKAVVGGNAFAHESGIHQDGMIKERTTYEIMRPEDVGWTGESMVMGKHSGRAAPGQAAGGAGIYARQGGDRAGLRAVQGAVRQEKGHLRRGPDRHRPRTRSCRCSRRGSWKTSRCTRQMNRKPQARRAVALRGRPDPRGDRERRRGPGRRPLPCARVDRRP